MRLGLRIVFFIVLTSIVPLLLLAVATTEVAGSQVQARIVDFELGAARSLGAVVTRQLQDTERVLVQQVSNFRLETASDEARAAFLVATYRLYPEIAVAVLLDADGQPITEPLYQPEGREPEIPEHDLVSEARLAAFKAALPAPPAPGEIAVGAPYRPEGAEAAVIPMVIRSARGEGVALAVELSLAPVASRMSALAEGREITVLDGRGAVLMRAGVGGLVEPERAQGLLTNAAVDLRYTTKDGVEVVAALARVPDQDWVVAVAEPADAVRATAHQIQARTWYVGGIALLVAVVGGVYLTRSITGPVIRLRDAARAVGGGDLRQRADIPGGDELAQLARDFNQMTESLERSAGEIAAKNAEIEKFNAELQDRVERRTAQLREAQARLVQSGQLAAIGELASGVAHELNNPLTGVLGILQILRMKAKDKPEAALLSSAEQEALRCKEIVVRLSRFTRPEDDPPTDDVVDLAAVVRDVLVLVGAALRERGVGVETRDLDSILPVRGDANQLGRAMSQLLRSARTVAAPGATLRLQGSVEEPDVVIALTLEPTVTSTDDWRAAGLGFWVARQVLQNHGATLEEGAEIPGGPRVWRIRAPKGA